MKISNLVSVIVPVYDVEKYLNECVESIISQSYKELDIILVDDGSTDSSRGIAESWALKDSRVRLIQQENAGLSSARNTGLQVACGEWVVFVDSDDYIHRDFVSQLVQVAQKTNSDIVNCRYKSFSNDNLKLKKDPREKIVHLAGVDSVNHLFAQHRGAYIVKSIYKKDLFIENDIVFPVGKTFEDVYTRPKLQYFASKVTYINDPLYYYRIRPDSITSTEFTKKKIEDRIGAVTELHAFFKTQGVTIDWRSFGNFSTAQLFNTMQYITASTLPYQKKLLDKVATAYRSYPHRLKYTNPSDLLLLYIRKIFLRSTCLYMLFRIITGAKK